MLAGSGMCMKKNKMNSTISFMIVLFMVLQQTCSATGLFSQTVRPIKEMVDGTLSRGQERQFGKQINNQHISQINASTKKQSVELQQVINSDWYQNMMADEEKLNQQPKVQIPESEMYEPYYYPILHYDAFNQGFRFDDFWSNTSECYYRMTNFTYIQDPQWRDVLDNSTYSGYFKVDNTTALISNTSNSLYYCVSMTRSWWEYVLATEVKFDSSWANWFAGFFQNLLTEVISMNNVYTSITDNQAIGNTTGVWYDSGRLLRILLIFDPIEPIDAFYNWDVPIPDGQQYYEYRQKHYNREVASDFWMQRVKSYFTKKVDKMAYKVAQNLKINKGGSKLPTHNNSFVFDDSFTNGGDLPTFDIDPSSLWEMTKGFLNSTGITYGGNRTGCEEAAVDVESGSKEAAELFTKDWYEFLNVLDAADQALLVGTSLNGITYDCYYGAEESYYLAGNYTDAYHNPDILLFNSVYNFGEVYDSMLMLYTYLNYPDLSTVTDYWDFGYEIGDIFKDLVYPTEETLEDEDDSDETTEDTTS